MRDQATKLSDPTSKQQVNYTTKFKEAKKLKICALSQWCTHLGALCMVAPECQQMDGAQFSLSRGVGSTLFHMDKGANDA